MTSRYHGSKILDHNKREFLNGDGEQRKSDRFTLVKNNFARASLFFVHFLAVVSRLRHEIS